MISVFSNVFDENRMLKNEYIQKKGYKSFLIADRLDRDEFLSVIRSIGRIDETEVTFVHSEFGMKEKYTTSIGFDSIWRTYSETWTEDTLIFFQSSELMVWCPFSHAFHVILGCEATVKSALSEIEHIYTCEDFIGETNLTPSELNFILKCNETYTTIKYQK